HERGAVPARFRSAVACPSRDGAGHPDRGALASSDGFERLQRAPDRRRDPTTAAEVVRRLSRRRASAQIVARGARTMATRTVAGIWAVAFAAVAATACQSTKEPKSADAVSELRDTRAELVAARGDVQRALS